MADYLIDEGKNKIEGLNKAEINEALNSKADAQAVANAFQSVNEALDGKASTQALNEAVQNINTALNGKANAESVNNAFNVIDNKFADVSEILPIEKEWQPLESINSITDKRASYNAQYQRITFASNQTGYACKVYQVTAGKYRIKGYGFDTNTTGVLAVLGNADIIESGASYCNLLQVIQTGSSEYTWHTVIVEIENDGYLYVNYSYVSGDKTSTVEKEIAKGKTVIITDQELTNEFLPANSKAVGEAIRKSTLTHGIIKSGNTYKHFSYSHDDKFIFRTIAPVGANGLYDYKELAIGHFENGVAVIDTTIWTAFTDQIGPISMRLHGDTGANNWTGGVHTKNIGGVEYPTAELYQINVYVNGVDITNSNDGIYYGDCRIISINKLYAPATITGADLSSATLAFLETRTFILIDSLKVQVKLKFIEDIDVGLYYGMQNQDNHVNTILLPTVGVELERTDMTSGAISNEKEWRIMLSDNNKWHYDMILSNYGLGDWGKNDGSSSYGRLSHYSTTKIYFVLCSGGTFEQNTIFFWEGDYKTYHE